MTRRLAIRHALPWVALACLAASCARQPAAGPAQSSASSGKGSAIGARGNNLLKASSFDDGKSVPWTTSFTAPADGGSNVEKGALCVEVKNAGSNPWDAQIRHREMTIQKGHTYTLQFKAYASTPTTARPKIGMSGPPYGEYWSATIDIGTEPQLYVGKFTMSQADDATAELAFHIGGSMAKASAPFKICIDDIRLDDPEFSGGSSAAVASVPNVLVNQVGYLPGAAKVATFKTAGKEPMEWQLADASGAVLATGKTTPFGLDGASGDQVQLIDFSSFDKPGQGLTLRVGNDTSHPFDIAPDLYHKLKYDALAYFYHNRSGIEIKMPFAGDEKLTRPAGHLHDNKVKCAPKSGCDYTLDVTGGWYDAGDHGKYVVNGGVSLWTMLNQYERAKALGGAVAEFGDGKMQIPERGNGVPDILDEARWQMEFMLRMQVPDGNPLAGMAHHKMHDENWTALGTAPHEDKQTRLLFPPSTAATLNLAATAAQCARIWKGLDAGFAGKCLKAAERAWVAARKNPKLLASATIYGGGAYDDENAADEFYWAAAELLATTGKPEYREYVEKSALDKRFPTEAGGHVSSFNWGTTDAMGMISLAVAPGVDKARADAIRKRIVAAADAFIKVQQKEGYRTPLGRTPDGKYIWGSNSFVLNNMVVLGLAHDFSKDKKYLDAMVMGMDYLLGRNPLGQSYVTGYGEKPLENPHHRFWAFQANNKYPKAPPGVVSGGPNSQTDDPYAKAAGLKGCKPEKCFVDHIEAWSVNEITINWNAPLAWVAAYLDEKGRATGK
jgi:endoglucanase